MISKPIVPLTLGLEEQGEKGDIHPTVPLTLELEERGGKGDIKPNGAIEFGIVGVRG